MENQKIQQNLGTLLMRAPSFFLAVVLTVGAVVLLTNAPYFVIPVIVAVCLRYLSRRFSVRSPWVWRAYGAGVIIYVLVGVMHLVGRGVNAAFWLLVCAMIVSCVVALKRSPLRHRLQAYRYQLMRQFVERSQHDQR